MLLTFDRLPASPGLEIVDHIERRQCTIQTPAAIDPTEASIDAFEFPVDRAVAFEAEALTLPHRMAVLVRNSLYAQIQELTQGESATLPRDRYSLDLTGPVKLYLLVDAELSIDVTPDGVRLEFGERTEVRLGARSSHENPAATITTTEDPEDLMAAVSMLGSALKTTSVERAYPSLRGHPPTIELGNELEVPAELEAPETGVTIEVPRDLRSVFVVAPLAYYLGADVVPDPAPKLRTDPGFEHALDDPARGFEGEVERVLKQTFFLDCLTRTEGFYPVDLHERKVIEERVDLDFASLYDASLPTQLERYLEVPYEVLEPEVPQWKLTARVEVVPENVEVLPFVINDLAVVKSPEGEAVSQPAGLPTGGDELVRAGDFTRGSSDTSRASADTASTPTLVDPETTDSLEQAWVGAGVPVGASKAMVEAFRHRLDRTPTDGDIDITVICNDRAMNNERDIVDDIYGSRDELPFDIHSHHELTIEELRTVLKQDCDFLHYIGHIDERGFECIDGYLDAETVEHTGVESFLLNACTSYQQGMELIRAGGVAGVVTVEDVINSGAERIGSTMAKLLNYGFPFSAALSIAKDESIVGGQYLVLGDGGVDIAQSKSGVPGLCRLSKETQWRLAYQTYPTSDKGLGSISLPCIGENSSFYITGGETGWFELTSEELADFLAIETQPVRYDDQLYWTDEFDVDALAAE